MAIKRYFAEADNTITNAFQENLSIRGTGSNMGQADVLETFSIYAQESSTSTELARILLQFPVSQIITDRNNEIVPTTGVSYYLKMFNARHPHTLPKNYKLDVLAVSSSWEEGNGLDMEGYTDITYDKIGSNWVKSAGSTAWTTAGGDYHASPVYAVSFDKGDEDLELDVTTLVNQWIAGTKENYGFGIHFSASYEASSSSNPEGAQFSYYTKKFFARSSEFYFDRPVLEARWDSTRKDNRGNFYFSSSLAPAAENLNTLYMYNYIRGNLRDIAGDSGARPVLNLYYSSASVPEGTALYFRNSSNTAVNFLSASRESKGVYKATFSVTGGAVTTTYPYLVDVWTLSGSEVHTGSVITPLDFGFSNFNPNSKHVVTIKNLKPKYTKGQTERFRLYVREKNWSPNIYTVAKTTPPNKLIESASYQICRAPDKKIVIPYGTGSTAETMLSYDSDGNYFDLDMDLLEAGYTYELKFSFYEDSLSSYREQPYTFKIRVEQDEY
jgi:hypothetical protein